MYEVEVMPVKKDANDHTVANGESSFQVLLEEVKKANYRLEVIEQAIPNLAYRLHCLENPEQTPYREIPLRQQYIPPEPVYHQKEIEAPRQPQPWEGEETEDKPKQEIKKPRKKLIVIGVLIIVGLWLLYIINGLAHGQQIVLPF